ncbi:MAG: methyltransferase domain-containing protein [Acidobacteria bacterium]|nr:methyltransferase domain-containing protein [Acidobacteriota bacterium]
MFTILKMLWRRPEHPEQAAVAMLGIRPGDTVLLLGAGRPDLAGAIGAVTGLNGQTTVVAADKHAESAVDAAAAKAGALVEVVIAPPTMLPLDNQTADMAILPIGLAGLGAEGPSVLAEAIRVVRPGGRISICEPLPRQGLFRLAHTGPVIDTAAVISRLTAAGLRAARHLGDLDGTAYFEAARAK